MKRKGGIIIRGITTLLLLLIFTMVLSSSVEAAKINKKTLTLVKGKTYTLKITGTKKKVSWKTSKKAVVKLGTKKKYSVQIKAVKTGKATITGRANGETYKCSINIVNPVMNKTKLTLKVGEIENLKVIGGTGKITWKSNNKSYATVDKNGKVTARKAGTVEITAMQNKKKMTCKITVTKNYQNGKPRLNATNVILYQVPNYNYNCSSSVIQTVKKCLPRNSAHPTSFQFKVIGTDAKVVRWRILEDKYKFSKNCITNIPGSSANYIYSPFVRETISKGLIEVEKSEPNGLMEYGEPIKFTLEAELTTGDVLHTSITVINEVDNYVENEILKFKEIYINDSMTEYEKMEKVAWYIQAKYDYSTNPNDVYMLMSGSGDCLASRFLVQRFCRGLGLKATAAPLMAQLGPNGNNYHGCTFVKADGVIYEVVTGYIGEKPRYYSIRKFDSIKQLKSYMKEGLVDISYFGIL